MHHILLERYSRFKFDGENSRNVTVRVYVKVSMQFVSSRFARKYKCKFDCNKSPIWYSDESFYSGSARNFEFKFDCENSTNVTVRVYVNVSRQIDSSRLARKLKFKFDRTNLLNFTLYILCEGIQTKPIFALRAKVQV